MYPERGTADGGSDHEEVADTGRRRLLALTIASPALAVPDRNPQMGQWEIVCDEPVGTIVVTAKGVPGWPTDWAPGSTPILLRAATFNVWVGGVNVDGPFAWTPPPGLESQLVGPCLLHLYGGSIATGRSHRPRASRGSDTRP